MGGITCDARNVPLARFLPAPDSCNLQGGRDRLLRFAGFVDVTAVGRAGLPGLSRPYRYWGVRAGTQPRSPDGALTWPDGCGIYPRSLYSSTCLKSALLRRDHQDNEHGSRNRQKYQGHREDSHEDLGLEGLRLPVLRRRHRVRTITRGRIVRVVRIRAAPPVRVPAIDHHASRSPSAATVALSRCRR